MLKERIPELDGLRGLAIGLVIFWHYVAGSVQVLPGSLAAYLLVPFSLTYTGVDLFFVISGFLIGGILLDAKQSPTYFRTFYIRRCLRILPLYYVGLAVFGLGLWLYASGARPLASLVEGVLPVYTYAVFAQNFWMAAQSGPTNALSHTWSLAVEEQFYLSLPLLVRLLPRQAVLVLAIAAVAMTPVVRGLLGAQVAYVLLPGRLDALYLGVLGAILVRSTWVRGVVAQHRMLPRLALGLFAIVYALLLLRVWRDLSFGPLALSGIAGFYLVVLLVCVLEPHSWMGRLARSAPLRGLGTICYGAYLLHLPLLLLSYALLLGRADGYPRLSDLASGLATAAALAATLLLSMLSWRYLEKPLIGYSHRWTYAA
jgi:peptidoglycan/LPS O-acetylase OafA/YrhL